MEITVHFFSCPFPVKPYFWPQEIIFLTSNPKNQICFSRSSYKWNVTRTLLCLASYALHDSVKIIHMRTCYLSVVPFLLSNILLYVYITFVFIYSLLYTHSLVDGYLNWFQVFIIINRTSVNTDGGMFFIKFKMGIEENFLNLIKGTFEPTVYIIQNGNMSALIHQEKDLEKYI